MFKSSSCSSCHSEYVYSIVQLKKWSPVSAIHEIKELALSELNNQKIYATSWLARRWRAKEKKIISQILRTTLQHKE